MQETQERRTEKRLRYHWPIWFAEDFQEALTQGQLIDISSKAAAFTCYKHENCPDIGQKVTARFSVPQYGPDNSFGMTSFVRHSSTYRVEEINPQLRKVTIQFEEALPFKPGEQSFDDAEQEQEALAVL